MNNPPANFYPIIPRTTAKSKSRRSTLNMSNINVQLATQYDDNYKTNI